MSQAEKILGSEFYWNYKTENDGRSSQGFENGTVIWPRGKCLGGSSSINGMIYVKGNSIDFKSWYDEGNREWHPKIVQYFYKKLESLQSASDLQNPLIRKNYGLNGLLVINNLNCTDTWDGAEDKVLKSLDEIGLKQNDDISALDAFGSGKFKVTATNGQRASTATAYLNTAQDRNNLKILTNAFVTKILIEDITKIAQGVEVEYRGNKITFFANLEVIVCAGTVNTPQLLMLSKIGPKEHLHSKGIKCLVDSPAVGRNLQDHAIVPVTIYGDKPAKQSTLKQNLDTIKYMYNRSGSLGHTRHPGITALYSDVPYPTYPKFQIFLNLFGKNTSAVTEYYKYRSYKRSIVKSVTNHNKNYALYEFTLALLHPYSKGFINLRSNNPMDPPLIYTNYLKDPRDLESCIIGIQMLTRIVNTEYFRSINGFLGRVNLNFCNNYKLDSVRYWRCICINLVTTLYHPVGTCKMGVSPKTSVVNSRLKVHGISKLRIIDASVMPNQVSANTCGATAMIGERGAALVIEDYLTKGHFYV